MDRKRIGLIVIGLIVFTVAVLVLRKDPTKEPLRMITWSNYYPDSLLAAFTAKTGIKVELSYVSSNEELLAKLKAGATGFDLIQPSDYMVRQMVKLDMLSPIDHSKLSNLSHLDEYYTNLPYDPGLKYSVPFTWGTTGIAVNTENVAIPKQGVGWDMLFSSPDAGHTSLLDDMREVFSAALMWKGQSINSADPQILADAKANIARVKEKILMFSPEPKALLEKGEIYIAHIYSTDGIQAEHDNPKFKYFIPREGAIIWTDNFAIPKTALKIDEAHAFINFFLDPENALAIAEGNLLATPNKTAKRKVSPSILANPNFYPGPEILSKLKFLDDAPANLVIIHRYWTELKSG